MLSAVSRIIVPFQAAPAGGPEPAEDRAEELTWGQREIWTAMCTQQSWLPIFWIRPVAAGTTVADIADELRYCLLRYESMRTRLSFTGTGEPRQVVATAGEVVLEVFEAGGTDPAQVAEHVQRQYREAAYDFVRDWPVRPAVVLRHGVPTHLVTVYCHLVMDAFARPLLLRDLASRKGDSPDQPASEAMQPRELAAWERTETARRASAASLTYWERLLRELPVQDGARTADPRRPRYWEAVLHSRALQLALHVISPDAPGATAPLLGLFALALARVTGRNPVVAQVVVSNRFRSHLAEVYAPVNQTGLWLVDLADTTVDDALRRGRRRAMSTYKNAYYDPRERAELIARLSRERGQELDIACFVNDRRMTAPPPRPAPSAAEVAAALKETTVVWRTRTDQPSERLFLHVEDVPGVVCLTAWTDTHHLGPDDLEAVLREMETVAVTAAFDPTAPTGVAATAVA